MTGIIGAVTPDTNLSAKVNAIATAETAAPGQRAGG